MTIVYLALGWMTASVPLSLLSVALLGDTGAASTGRAPEVTVGEAALFL